jgi:hypothetical protein
VIGNNGGAQSPGNSGVLPPPSNIDPGIQAARPPGPPGLMPVIPPPGTPGGNPDVQPK